MNRLLFLLLLLVTSGCAGEQTRSAFSLRPPASVDPVSVADHAKEHEANLEQALESSVRAQEAADDREWSARERANKVVAALPAKPCVVHDVDSNSCADPPKSPAE